MTYIEFFDTTVPENICTCLAAVPDKVVLIGDKLKVLEKHAQRYQEIFARRGHQVAFECRSVSKSNMQSILDALTQIIQETDDCVFDLTGGEDLYLVAAGILSQRFPEKQIQMHRFNLHTGTLIDCDRDGVTIERTSPLVMTVEENVLAYGGAVLDPAPDSGWDLNGEFLANLFTMWEICRREPRNWNAQIGVLAAVQECCPGEELSYTVTLQQVADRLQSQGLHFVYIRRLIQALYQEGLLTQCSFDGASLQITYKNRQVMRCLTKAGQVLELLVFLAARETCDKKGLPVYNDVCTGVSIDWDGRPQADGVDTENEIDVMMMHGVIPVFVSCKNGRADITELYKLQTVADRFGGTYAKKVLVATALDAAGTYDDYFRQRAKDMHIRLVENAGQLPQKELERIVASFWSN